jgi:hypothetical protein
VGGNKKEDEEETGKTKKRGLSWQDTVLTLFTSLYIISFAYILYPLFISH